MTDSGKSGGWIKRLMSKAGSVMGSPAHPEQTEYFSWLDQVEKGLTAKVVSYIQTQDNATVIATLEALSAQILNVRHKRQGSNDFGSQDRSLFCIQSIINKKYDIGQKER